LAESFALLQQQIWTIKSDGICGQQTISAAFRPLNILHMGLMSDAAEWCWLLMAHVNQAMPIFGRGLRAAAESLALSSKSGPKAMAFVVNKPYQLPLPSDP
jgi:hypothetical protein